jgi:hypothetical protein
MLLARVQQLAELLMRKAHISDKIHCTMFFFWQLQVFSGVRVTRSVERKKRKKKGRKKKEKEKRKKEKRERKKAERKK